MLTGVLLMLGGGALAVPSAAELDLDSDGLIRDAECVRLAMAVGGDFPVLSRTCARATRADAPAPLAPPEAWCRVRAVDVDCAQIALDHLDAHGPAAFTFPESPVGGASVAGLGPGDSAAAARLLCPGAVTECSARVDGVDVFVELLGDTVVGLRVGPAPVGLVHVTRETWLASGAVPARQTQDATTWTLPDSRAVTLTLFDSPRYGQVRWWKTVSLGDLLLTGDWMGWGKRSLLGEPADGLPHVNRLDGTWATAGPWVGQGDVRSIHRIRVIDGRVVGVRLDLPPLPDGAGVFDAAWGTVIDGEGCRLHPGPPVVRACADGPLGGWSLITVFGADRMP